MVFSLQKGPLGYRIRLQMGVRCELRGTAVYNREFCFNCEQIINKYCGSVCCCSERGRRRVIAHILIPLWGALLFQFGLIRKGGSQDVTRASQRLIRRQSFQYINKPAGLIANYTNCTKSFLASILLFVLTNRIIYGII